ncbi:hypothetical protein HA466_0208700 [Hirschfeldia incana]|nr:hypothetical protein HA466_0208700 [Hirschfeldia incana]
MVFHSAAVVAVADVSTEAWKLMWRIPIEDRLAFEHNLYHNHRVYDSDDDDDQSSSSSYDDYHNHYSHCD